MQRALEAARRDFAAELDKQRAAGELAEERLRASETRALLEIDRERVAASRAQKALDDLVRKSEQRDERYRKQEAALQAQVGDLRHQVGILEGNLSAGRAESKALKRSVSARSRSADSRRDATRRARVGRSIPPRHDCDEGDPQTRRATKEIVKAAGRAEVRNESEVPMRLA